MKKLKRLWKENRILMILATILIACLIAILCVCLKYFVGSGKSKYGNRYDNMKYKITEKEQKDYKKVLEGNSSISKVTLRVNQKTIMVSVKFKPEIKKEDAKKIIETSLDSFSDNVKETYDVNFTIHVGSDDHVIMGARNASGNGLFWNNDVAEEKK